MELDPKLPAMMGIAAALDILIPIVLVLWLRRKLGTKWVVFGLGALAFGLSRVLLITPLVNAAQKHFQGALLLSVILAVIAAATQETVRYACYAKALKDESNWRNAVSLGAGHGGLEVALFAGGVMIIGALNGAAMMNVDVQALSANPENLARYEAAKATLLSMAWWSPLLTALGSIPMLGLQLAFSVMVLQAYVRKQWRWFLLAVGAHITTDVAPSLAMRQFGGLAAGLVLTGFFALAIWFVLRMRDADGTPPQTRAAPA